MFARDGMMPWRTALQNVEFGLEVRNVANRSEIAREWLRRVGLDKFEGHYRHELSRACASASRWRAPSRSSRTSC